MPKEMVTVDFEMRKLPPKVCRQLSESRSSMKPAPPKTRKFLKIKRFTTKWSNKKASDTKRLVSGSCRVPASKGSPSCPCCRHPVNNNKRHDPNSTLQITGTHWKYDPNCGQCRSAMQCTLCTEMLTAERTAAAAAVPIGTTHEEEEDDLKECPGCADCESLFESTFDPEPASPASDSLCSLFGSYLLYLLHWAVAHWVYVLFGLLLLADLYPLSIGLQTGNSTLVWLGTIGVVYCIFFSLLRYAFAAPPMEQNRQLEKEFAELGARFRAMRSDLNEEELNII